MALPRKTIAQLADGTGAVAGDYIEVSRSGVAYRIPIESVGGVATAAALLAKILTVDGAGSGLDADLLDGQSGAYYAPIASPTFTGTPAAPTAAVGTDTTQIATTAFVQDAVTPPSPAVTVYTSGSGTFTTPTGTRRLRIRMVGGGGGGQGGGGSPGAGGDGGDTTFGTLTASKGYGGGASGTAGGAGGTGTNGDVNLAGGAGAEGATGYTYQDGGNGGATPFGAPSRTPASKTGVAPPANTGCGGSGGCADDTASPGGGGGGGGYVEKTIASPAATYSYSVGTGGTGGTVGTGTWSSAGVAGSAGLIIVEAF